MYIVGAVALPHPPVILPEIGKGEERKIAVTRDAIQRAVATIKELKPDTLVLISPHTALYSGWFHISPGTKARGTFTQFGAPTLTIETEYDQQLANEIEKTAKNYGIPAGTKGERNSALDHGTMIPLYFLHKAGVQLPIVRIGLSGFSLLEHYFWGQAIGAASKKMRRRVVVVASGDLSHKLKEEGPYGFVPEGPQLDTIITQALEKGAFEKLLHIPEELAEKGAECGLRSFVIMAGMLDKHSVEAKLLSYQDTFGVGYVVASFVTKEENPKRAFGEIIQEEYRKNQALKNEQADEYVRLAQKSIAYFCANGEMGTLPAIKAEMQQEKAGVFVSLKKHDELRGCIGTIFPVTENIGMEIWRNAVLAASEDPRFLPLTVDELSQLTIHVDVLGAPENIADLQQLDPKEYGVIVTQHEKRGLLLPNLEGIKTAQQQVSIACQKAGIQEGTEVELQRFRVTRHD